MARAQYWRDNQIEAGTNWWDEIRANLESAEIVLFFISQGFLDSKFIASDELPPALARLEKKEARLIPIILSVCGWQESPIGKLNIQALPRSAKAVLNWDDKTEALLNIAEELNKIIDKLAAKASSESFSQLAGAASTSGTRLAMNEFQETFTASSGQASAIADYKDVHELLHQLKFECLEMLKVSAFRFPERQALRDARNYASTFRDKVDAVAAIAERMLPPDPYVKMISASLKTLRETIQTALDKSDRASLDRFIRVLESGLATWPTGIAIRVNRAAQNLRLPDLIAAMDSIGGRLGPSVLDFERGGSAEPAQPQTGRSRERARPVAERGCGVPGRRGCA